MKTILLPVWYITYSAFVDNTELYFRSYLKEASLQLQFLKRKLEAGWVTSIRLKEAETLTLEVSLMFNCLTTETEK